MAPQSLVANPLFNPFVFLYQIAQWLVDLVLSPKPPKPGSRLGRPKIAIIGAGITGVSSAAHCVGHGFDVVIFEAGDEDSLGGIWSQVNTTSSLQIHSAMFRFHPSVKWDGGYPDRQQILSQVRQVWERYGLGSKTRFGTRVERVYQDAQGRWVVNEAANGRFEGVIAAVGTCGRPKMPRMDGLEDFKGEVRHSSRLTTGRSGSTRGKTMVVIGGGASAVEALEHAAAEGAAKVYVLARSDKWIIPRNPAVDVLLSLNILGRETALSWIPEALLRKLFYRDLEHIAPDDKGIFQDTPMVNSDIMRRLRSGEAEWVRGDIVGFAERGVVVNQREKGVAQGGPGRRRAIDADMIVMATGFERPPLDFLPADCFDDDDDGDGGDDEGGKPGKKRGGGVGGGGGYGPPNWYLQTFPPRHPSISAINCTYVSAIGTVGNWHIGIYTRVLLMFLADPRARPSPRWMRRWIDMTRLLKSRSPTGAFDFFTYLELVWWFAFCVAFNPFRWKWALFVFFGVGLALPRRVVAAEERLRRGLGAASVDDEGPGRDVGSSF